MFARGREEIEEEPLQGGAHGSEARISKSQFGGLELTDTTSVRLVYTRPFQITLLEEEARTKVRRHGATEVGIVRNRQGLQGTREGSWYSLLQTVVVQVELGESGEG